VPIEAGWTIVGNPYPSALGFSQLGVRRSDGTVLTMQQALNAGVIFNDLVGWTGAAYTHHEQFLQPFKGYFLFAFEPVTLIMPNPAMITSLPARSLLAEASPEVRRFVEALLPRVSGAELAIAPPFRIVGSGSSPWENGFFAALLPQWPRFVAPAPFRLERRSA
jgi:hypothetical protein